MIFPGHLAGGYLAARSILAIMHPALTSVQTDIVLLAGTLAGDLPDIDIIFFYFNQRRSETDPKKIESHRDYITHAPIFSLAICAVIVLTGLIARDLFLQVFGVVILGGIWSHYILDSLEYGIRWLWPFSDKRLCLKDAPPEAANDARPGTFKYYINFVRDMYVKSWTFYLETAITLAALYFLIK